MTHSLNMPTQSPSLAPDAASVEPLEVRLAGRQATLDGILRAIHEAARRHRPATPWTRLELRHTSERPLMLSDRELQKRIQALLVEQSMPRVLVSVRRLDSRLEDAAGEHLLCFYGAREVPQQPQARKALSRLWRALSRLWGGPHDESRPRQEPDGEGLAAQAVSPGEAAQLLAEAVQSAARLHRQRQVAEPVSAMELIVRLPEAHARLQTLVEQDPAAPRALARQLRSHGLRVAEGFALAYRFLAPSALAATAMAGEMDVEVKLITERSPGHGDLPGLPADANTALPASTRWQEPTALPVQAPRVEVLLRGTQQATFDPPARLVVSRFPATLDRAALAAAGLGAHGEALTQALSNRAALRLELQGQRVVLHAPRRATERGELPLYHQRRPGGEQGEALAEHLELGAQPLVLWLNDLRAAASGASVLWAEIRVCG